MSDDDERYREAAIPDLSHRQTGLVALGLTRALSTALCRVFDLTPPEQAASIAELRAELIQEARNAVPQGVPMQDEAAVVEAVVGFITLAFPALAEGGDDDG